jgi:hypothetical protein
MHGSLVEPHALMDVSVHREPVGTKVTQTIGTAQAIAMTASDQGHHPAVHPGAVLDVRAKDTIHLASYRLRRRQPTDFTKTSNTKPTRCTEQHPCC